MKKIIYACLYALLGAFPVTPGATTLTVSKSFDGAFKTIQAAVDASESKDSILIIDSGIYEECVSIVLKRNLTILSKPSDGAKPVISFQDIEHIRPTTCIEARDSATINYFKNGALRILESSNITIDGIIIDSKKPFPFGSSYVWDAVEQCQFPVQSGNSSIAIFRSSNVTIKNCDITNAYYGIYFTGYKNSLPDGSSLQPIFSTDNSVGCTGNHDISHNRIHHNTYGLYFEHDHDMGIVINNNIFYNNCHENGFVARQVESLTSEGANQASGAIMFKFFYTTPVAIYNNTFYNNFLLLTGQWRPGNSYLIFNNIYGPPHTYWSADTVFGNHITAFDPIFSNRMFNCLYACQTAKAGVQKAIISRYDNTSREKIPIDTIVLFQPRIMNEIDNVEQTDWHLSYDSFDTTLASVKLPGNRIIGVNKKAFPSTANIRWLEPKFKSTDPTSAEFLEPDWNDSLMHSFIPDKGWAESGIRDADGSTADIGAISSCGISPQQIRIIPAAILTDRTLEMIPFHCISDNPLTDCRIEYCRFINYNPIDSNSYGVSTKPLPLESIHNVTTSGNVITGLNLIQCKITGSPVSLTSGHFELIISGVNEHGIRISSKPGFIPVRISTESPVMDISLNTTDTSSITGQNKTVTFTLKARPGISKVIYRQISLQNQDGSSVLNKHGKSIFIDSLVVSSETVPADNIMFADTFSVANTPSTNALAVIFKARKGDTTNPFSYSTHFVKLSTVTSINNYSKTINSVEPIQQPQLAVIYNLMGKKIQTIPYSSYSISRVQPTLPRGIYIVRLFSNINEIKESGVTKFIVH